MITGTVLIGCRGGDPDAPNILASEGWQYGFRSDYTGYAHPYFIDIKWKQYDWDKHLSVIAKWNPHQAMVADYLIPDQTSLMLSQVADIRALGVIPMVCPKFPGAVWNIPNDCIVAVSVPTQYAGYLPSQFELFNRPVHFLGGHPDQFYVLKKRYLLSHIVSIDCSAIFQKAQFGAFWSSNKNTWRYTKGRFSTHTLTRMSARQVRKYLSGRPIFQKRRKRLDAIGCHIQRSISAS